MICSLRPGLRACVLPGSRVLALPQQLLHRPPPKLHKSLEFYQSFPVRTHALPCTCSLPRLFLFRHTPCTPLPPPRMHLCPHHHHSGSLLGRLGAWHPCGIRTVQVTQKHHCPFTPGKRSAQSRTPCVRLERPCRAVSWGPGRHQRGRRREQGGMRSAAARARR